MVTFNKDLIKVTNLKNMTNTGGYIMQKAFTLAEVLITLGIIGIVAALTMPSLIGNYQKKQAVTILQREINVIQNALKRSEVDNGEMTTWNFGNIGIEGNTKIFGEKYFLPYLKTIKTCIPASDECWTRPNAINGTPANMLLGLEQYQYRGAAILNDGAALFFWANHPADPEHAQIWIDINGPKKGPNTLGKDVFGTITGFNNELPYKGKTNFLGTEDRNSLINDEGSGCSKDIPGDLAGRFCGALIQYDGWEIKDDYPW